MSWIKCNEQTFKDEDWPMLHLRYAADHYKLDADLFELRDGGLMKKGGTGRLEYHEVEYLLEDFHLQPGDNYVAQILSGMFSGQAPQKSWADVVYGLRAAMITAQKTAGGTALVGQLNDVACLLYDYESRRINDIEELRRRKPTNRAMLTPASKLTRGDFFKFRGGQIIHQFVEFTPSDQAEHMKGKILFDTKNRLPGSRRIHPFTNVILLLDQKTF